VHIVFLCEGAAFCCGGNIYRSGIISDQALKGALHNESRSGQKSKAVCRFTENVVRYQEGNSAGVK